MAKKVDEFIMPPIEFTAAGATEEESIANLEAVLPSPGFGEAALLMADALAKRADIVVLDFAPQAVTVRFQIDGIWHNLPQRDRQSSDFMLASLKKLANVDYQERRLRQEGTFRSVFRFEKSSCRMVSQGIKTGERVALYIDRPKPPLNTLEELGMRSKLGKRLVDIMHAEKGLILLSTLPGDGLSTLFAATLNDCDRLTRDYVSLDDMARAEPEQINVTQNLYDSENGQSPLDVLRDVLLKEPDVVCFPHLHSAEVINRMCDLVNEENRTVLACVNAKSGAEALLRVLVHRCDLKKFADAVTCVVHGRLARRLCENCKQPFVPAPALLQKLGIPAGRVEAFYSRYQPPPPEQMTEEFFCADCENLGFRERIGFYELMEVNDGIRKVLLKSPDVNSITKAAKKAGEVSLRDEGVVMMAKGVTSIDELQRVLKK